MRRCPLDGNPVEPFIEIDFLEQVSNLNNKRRVGPIAKIPLTASERNGRSDWCFWVLSLATGCASLPIPSYP